MVRITNTVKALHAKSLHTFRAEGAKGLAITASRFLYYRQFPNKKPRHAKDILFINGCTLPHPERYRVQHQMEQLLSAGISSDAVFYDQLTMDRLRYYRGFVFFRCPVTDTVRDFITAAKAQNKTCFFDIDDLVIDQKYTDQIEFVAAMAPADKAHYDDGVNRMRETLELCDYAITTTERLQTELKHYTKEVFINRNVVSDEMAAKSNRALKVHQPDDSKVVIGYFSGSITHNEDFAMILPSLIKLLDRHKNVHLKIAGLLDLPPELEVYRNRIISVGFTDWRLMPAQMVSCDINLAPLTDTIFNEAKSENKWAEAALVGVVTAASNIGAFKHAIKNGVDGVLVNDSDWFKALDDLVTHKDKRTKLGQAARKTVLAHNTTTATCGHLARYVRDKLARNVAFVLPSTDISGGVNVILKHADILRDAGWDVTLIDAIDKVTLRKAQRQYKYRMEIPGYNVLTKAQSKIELHFDTMVASLWSTLEVLQKYPNVKNRLYFVQNYETDFYEFGFGQPRFLANGTYFDDTGVKYVTMSLWCQNWLKEDFGQDAKYTSNGIDLEFYPARTRDFGAKTINILIEGDSRSEYKNTDEAFRIVEKLDPAMYKVSYLSYRREPKDWYRVDYFYNRISPDKVGEVYAKCDILIKTSLLESFSYPPLEMMATEGISLVVPNDGNREYLRDGQNCLFYEQGNIDDALAKFNQIMTDAKLRQKLIKGGRETADKYQWSNIVNDVLAIYQ